MCLLTDSPLFFCLFPLCFVPDELLQVPVPGYASGCLFPILVSAYFDGAMLQSHYRNPRYAAGMELDEFLDVAVSLANIVASIHANQIIHRDLTAANILYQPRGKLGRDVRVIDFGISTPFPQSNANQVKQLQGTMHYLSPEQTGRIGRIVDYRTDIFSLGVVLYQVRFCREREKETLRALACCLRCCSRRPPPVFRLLFGFCAHTRFFPFCLFVVCCLCVTDVDGSSSARCVLRR